MSSQFVTTTFSPNLCIYKSQLKQQINQHTKKKKQEFDKDGVLFIGFLFLGFVFLLVTLIDSLPSPSPEREASAEFPDSAGCPETCDHEETNRSAAADATKDLQGGAAGV